MLGVLQYIPIEYQSPGDGDVFQELLDVAHLAGRGAKGKVGQNEPIVHGKPRLVVRSLDLGQVCVAARDIESDSTPDSNDAVTACAARWLSVKAARAPFHS